MPISVYIDNNVWDFLFERQLDLSVELPRSEYCLCMTREAEFEIPPIPPEKAALKAFINKTIQDCLIETRPLFGWNDSGLAADEQRVGGWGIGYWASASGLAFIEKQQKTTIGNIKSTKTRLYKNEADISLAARSFEAVVLSLDKSGPINNSYKEGGMVVFLTEFDKSGVSLSEFIKRKKVNKTSQKRRKATMATIIVAALYVSAPSLGLADWQDDNRATNALFQNLPLYNCLTKHLGDTDALEKCEVKSDGSYETRGAVWLMGYGGRATPWMDDHCVPIVQGYKCTWHDISWKFQSR